MAIMWDPPAERRSLEPTAAELAWKRWVMEALIAKDNDAPPTGEARNDSDEPLKSAA